MRHRIRQTLADGSDIQAARLGESFGWMVLTSPCTSKGMKASAAREENSSGISLEQYCWSPTLSPKSTSPCPSESQSTAVHSWLPFAIALEVSLRWL